MIKKILLLSLLLGLKMSMLSAQDLILTKGGDSINCKILEVKSEYIFYLTKSNLILLEKRLGIQNVSNFSNNYFSQNIISTEELQEYLNRRKTRISFSGGYSHLTGKVSSQLSTSAADHVKKLKSGFNAGAEFNYFLNQKWGIGAKYSQFFSSASSPAVRIKIDQELVTIAMDEKMNIHYFGPTFVSQLLSRSNKNAVSVFGFSLGLMSYLDEATMNNTTFWMQGKTPAMALSYAMDYKVNKEIFLGFNFNLYSATLTQITYRDTFQSFSVDLEPENYENISRIDISVSLRF